jgi:hypothetical protein
VALKPGILAIIIALLASFITGFLSSAVAPTMGGIVARASLDILNHVLAPLVLILLVVLAVSTRAVSKRAWKYVKLALIVYGTGALVLALLVLGAVAEVRLR